MIKFSDWESGKIKIPEDEFFILTRYSPLVGEYCVGYRGYS